MKQVHLVLLKYFKDTFIKTGTVVNDLLGLHKRDRQLGLLLFCLILKTGDGRTPRVNIVITTSRVLVALMNQYSLMFICSVFLISKCY